MHAKSAIVTKLRPKEVGGWDILECWIIGW